MKTCHALSHILGELRWKAWLPLIIHMKRLRFYIELQLINVSYATKTKEVVLLAAMEADDVNKYLS